MIPDPPHVVTTWMTVVRDMVQILTPVVAILGAGWAYMGRFRSELSERIDALTEQVKRTNGSVIELKQWRADHERFLDMRLSSLERGQDAIRQNCLEQLSSHHHRAER